MVKSTSGMSPSTKTEKEMVSWDGKNYSFPKFDRLVSSWARNKWNPELGKKLWEDTLHPHTSTAGGRKMTIYDLPETSDPWIEHCEMVHRFNIVNDFKNANALHGSSVFWTHGYQKNWIASQQGKLHSKVEASVKGAAETVVVTHGPEEAESVRAALMKKFGNARAVNLKTREQLYNLGMPPTDSNFKPNGEAFTEKTNLVDKFEELEDEMHELIAICPPHHQKEYREGKESTLVRIVTTYIHKSYNAVVQSVTAMERIRKAGGLTSQKTIDLHEHAYSDDHLPDWNALKDALIQQYDVNSKSWGGDSRGSSNVPSMMMNNGGGGSKCFACGESGHRRGDSECQKGPRDVHDSAPDWVKNQAKNRGGNKKGGNGSNGKPICRYFAQHGTCKCGKGCKFSHAEKGTSKDEATKLFGSKAGYKRAVAMVAQSLTDGAMAHNGSKKQKCEKNDQDDPCKKLYSMMTSCNENKGE